MATRSDIESTYNYMDRLWRLSLGDHADITCAYFDGDFTKTLDEAQRAKHELIFELTQLRAGQRVLDIGCGWGGFLRAAAERGVEGKGITLSSRQARVCQRAGLDVEIHDWNDPMDDRGPYDAVVSVGAFEHFCSKEAYIEGRQSAVYRRFFEVCHDLLAPGGRMFLQTMTWGRAVPDPRSISLAAPRKSDGYILGVVEQFYPGSWLPSGLDQIREHAAPRFSVEWFSSGRADYIETLSRWGRKTSALHWKKILPAVQVLVRAAFDKTYRYRLEMLRNGYNRECFRRHIMDHYRMMLQRQ